MSAVTLINLVWVLSCALLVMLMQAGFCLLETGFSRAKNSVNVAIKNLVDFLISSLLFWAFGFAVMFGASFDGLFGTSRFAPSVDAGPALLAGFFFQMMFCSTSTTIISGAVAERIRFGAYLVVAVFVATVVYPVFGHWAWGGAFDGRPSGWLAHIGFIDFAGSSVVHSVGGWVALALCLQIGPRIGRFSPNTPPMAGHNLPMSTIGALLLWFSWFGFNGGSAMAMTEVVPLVLLNTNLAAAAGGVVALGMSWRIERRADVGHVINGVLAGLVGVTASCNVISPSASVVVGAVAGAISVVGTYWIARKKIDDVVGAIPVHGFCGAWGTLAVALFGDVALFPNGASRGYQIAVQGLGIVTCFVWAFGSSYCVFGLIQRRFSFRVSREAELRGLNVSEHGASTELLELLTNMDRHYRAGDFRNPVPVEPHTEVGQIAAEYNRVIRRANTEIRAREQAAAAARTAEEKYRSIFENAVEGMFQTTPDGRYLAANPALARIYGYESCEELIKTLDRIDVRLYVEAARRDEFRRLVERDGTVRDFESAVRRRDGSVIWISENARSIRDESGQVVSYEGTVVDITARREALALQAQMEAAEAASRTKSEFMANMSHEIRTPLNGVMGMLELLGTTSLDSRQQRFVHLARSSADALLGLINQILDFSKIEAGKVELEAIEFRLHPLVEDLAEVFGHRAQKKGVELSCRIHTDVPDCVVGDPERIRQVLVNLTNNAVKFTDVGSVDIELSCAPDGGGRTNVRFAVHDSGIGIPGDRRDRLFRPFMQVDASTTRKYGGTGLGLSICKQLIEAMGGTIEYVPRIGGGSTFQFVVPLETAIGAAPQPKLLPEELRRLSILAVDDVEANRELLIENFDRWGVAIDTAVDAADAWKKASTAADRGAAYDLLILDRRLPDMDGLDLARRIHAEPSYAAARMVLLTSLSDTPHRDELKQLGIATVMSKPIRQSQLFDGVVSACRNAEQSKTGISLGSPCEVLSPAGGRKPRGPRILVAEDNEINQMVTREILEREGYACRVVADGRQALAALEEETFAIVLMDCQMPEMDGFTAVGEIRKREAAGKCYSVGGALPVVALTANAVRGDRELCLSAGMSDYVTKPIDRNFLLSTIAKWLNLQDVAASGRPSLNCEAPAAAAEESTAGIVTAGDVDATAPVSPRRVEVIERSDPEDFVLAEALKLEDLLDRCNGDRSFAAKLLKKFCDKLPRDYESLRSAAASGDRDELRRQAHKLKGCANNMGAQRLGFHAATIEAEFVAAAPEFVASAVDELRREVDLCLEKASNLLEEFNRI